MPPAAMSIRLCMVAQLPCRPALLLQVGRAIEGSAAMAADLAKAGRSLLLLGVWRCTVGLPLPAVASAAAAAGTAAGASAAAGLRRLLLLLPPVSLVTATHVHNAILACRPPWCGQDDRDSGAEPHVGGRVPAAGCGGGAFAFSNCSCWSLLLVPMFHAAVVPMIWFCFLDACPASTPIHAFTTGPRMLWRSCTLVGFCND